MDFKSIPTIPSSRIEEDFLGHLKEEYNSRILFSAPFGSGKSTFLKSFFDRNEQYLTVKLFPVNYSVANNEDVFELIKYDIIYELLSNYPEDVNLDNEKFSMLLISQMFFLHNMKVDSPIKLLLKAGEFLSGKSINSGQVIEDISKSLQSFSSYTEKINKTEFDNLKEYVSSFKTKKGSIYEADKITDIITGLLETAKQSLTKSSNIDSQNGTPSIETVLIIDDLDRLDPEHVFRLFNIFSAHYDEINDNNKFGFDKIIFVCDIANIYKMFTHKYGLSVEFNGYIDKFYSSNVYYFDIKRFFKETLWDILKGKINLDKHFKDDPTSITSFAEKYQINPNSQFFKPLSFILEDFIDFDLIHIRSIKRFSHYSIPKEKIKSKYGFTWSMFFPGAVLLLNLQKFFARPSDLINALEVLYKSYFSNYSPKLDGTFEKNRSQANLLIEYAIPFLIEDDRAFGNDYEFQESCIIETQTENGQKVFIHYKTGYNHEYSYNFFQLIGCTSFKDTDEISSKNLCLNPNPYWFLYKAYEKILQKKYFMSI